MATCAKLILPKMLPMIVQRRGLHLSALRAHGLYVFFNRHKNITDPARQNPAYFEILATRLPLDDHYFDALRELWEEKYGSERDLGLRAADYLIGNTTDYALPEVDPSQPRLEYRNVEALRTAPESVKKIFSVGFGSKEDIAKQQKWSMMRSVNFHEYDMESLQAQIAWATGCIREWTALVDWKIAKHKQNKKPQHLIQRIQRMIFHRRGLLAKLNEIDAAEYEKVLSELKIHHNPPSALDPELTRKIWSEEQLRRRAHKEKESRMAKLHKKMMDGREEKVAQMDKELSDLDEEEQRIKRRTAEILEIEGRTMRGVAGKYQPKLIEEFTEIALHSLLFYHPKPTMAK